MPNHTPDELENRRLLRSLLFPHRIERQIWGLRILASMFTPLSIISMTGVVQLGAVAPLDRAQQVAFILFIFGLVMNATCYLIYQRVLELAKPELLEQQQWIISAIWWVALLSFGLPIAALLALTWHIHTVFALILCGVIFGCIWLFSAFIQQYDPDHIP